MRTTFNLDDDLLGEAQRLTGMTERTALIHEGVRALMERESARRLARPGGTERSLRVPPHRREKSPKGTCTGWRPRPSPPRRGCGPATDVWRPLPPS